MVTPFSKDGGVDYGRLQAIVEEQVDGDIVWGHLKSGVGWVIINDLLDNGGYILDD